jgi:predicted nucleotidyltransferase
VTPLASEKENPYYLWKRYLADLLDELPRVAKGGYGKRLISLVIFGSVAKGVATPASDLDLLLLLTSRPRSSYETFREFYAGVIENLSTFRLAKKDGISFDIVPIILTLEALRPTLPFLWDGRFQILFDRGDTFSRFVDETLQPFVREHIRFSSSPLPHFTIVKPWSTED